MSAVGTGTKAPMDKDGNKRRSKDKEDESMARISIQTLPMALPVILPHDPRRRSILCHSQASSYAVQSQS